MKVYPHSNALFLLIEWTYNVGTDVYLDEPEIRASFDALASIVYPDHGFDKELAFLVGKNGNYVAIADKDAYLSADADSEAYFADERDLPF